MACVCPRNRDSTVPCKELLCSGADGRCLSQGWALKRSPRSDRLVHHCGVSTEPSSRCCPSRAAEPREIALPNMFCGSLACNCAWAIAGNQEPFRNKMRMKQIIGEKPFWFKRMVLSLSPCNPVVGSAAGVVVHLWSRWCQLVAGQILTSAQQQKSQPKAASTFIIFSSDLVGPAKEWAVALSLCLVLMLAFSGSKSDVCHLLLVVTWVIVGATLPSLCCDKGFSDFCKLGAFVILFCFRVLAEAKLCRFLYWYSLGVQGCVCHVLHWPDAKKRINY